MEIETIKKLFKTHISDKIISCKKVSVGFTNDVYIVNSNFILKVCKNKDNEVNFKKEAFFYKLFYGKIPVPELITYDFSKKVIDNHFIICKKLPGINLYSKWHILSLEKRKDIVKQICEIIKIINKEELETFASEFKVQKYFSWHDKVITSIKGYLREVSEKELISKDLALDVSSFIDKNKPCLTEQKLALVYWDLHFDNILIDDNDNVSGIIDFERTNISSIDFGLDIIKRMAEYPTKYVSEESEKNVIAEDYSDLLSWFEEYYPELFMFKDITTRLKFYALEHDLSAQLHFPEVKEIADSIKKDIS